jgi:hypothetical protein
MKKLAILTVIFFWYNVFSSEINAQTYFTKSGLVTFSATGPIKNIKGENKKGTLLLDAKSGNLQVGLLMVAFEFPRGIFQNVDYLESDKYPKSGYKGKITNISAVDFSKNGSYPISLTGDLTLHGVTHNAPSKGTLTVAGDKITIKAKFLINLEEYNVDIPGILVNDKAVSIDLDAWLVAK